MSIPTMPQVGMLLIFTGMKLAAERELPPKTTFNSFFFNSEKLFEFTRDAIDFLAFTFTFFIALFFKNG
jgi:hypothetical protein